MSILKRYNGSSWVTVPDGTAFKYYNGSSWVNPSAVKYYNGSSWVTAWNKSDPITLRYAVTDAQTMGRAATYMEWNPVGNAGYAYVGCFSGSRDRVGVYNFNLSTPTSGSGSLSSNLSTRPVVKSAFFTTKRHSSSGSSAATGTIYLGVYTGAYNTGTPDYNLLDFNPEASLTWTSGNTLGFSQVHTWTLGASYGQALANALNSGDYLAMSARTSGWDSGKSTDSIYSRWQGPATGYTGYIDITLDYI